MFGNSDRTGSAGWLIAETLVVVLGILIAFQLESWREQWNVREKERITIISLLEDLDDDDWELEKFIETSSAQKEAFRRLALHFHEGPFLAREELEHLSRRAAVGRNWTPSAPTFEGLKANNNFELISDPDLRNEIIGHFGGWEVYLGTLAEKLYDRVDEFSDAAQLDFVGIPKDDNPGSGYSWVLIHEMSDLPSHPELRGRIGRAGVLVNWVVMRMNLGLERNQELREKLEDHLELLDRS